MDSHIHIFKTPISPTSSQRLRWRGNDSIWTAMGVALVVVIRWRMWMAVFVDTLRRRGCFDVRARREARRLSGVGGEAYELGGKKEKSPIQIRTKTQPVHRVVRALSTRGQAVCRQPVVRPVRM